jgi:hypothetical protein
MKIDFSIPLEKSLGASNTKIQTVPQKMVVDISPHIDPTNPAHPILM